MDYQINYPSIIRKQRHDFMNDLQVIYGYLQLEKYATAESCIEKVCKQNEIIRELYNLGDDFFAMCLENKIRELWAKEIQVDINIELDFLKNCIFEKDREIKWEEISKIFDACKEMEIEYIYLYIYEDAYGINLKLCNNSISLYNESTVDFSNAIYSLVNRLYIFKNGNREEFFYHIIIEN